MFLAGINFRPDRSTAIRIGSLDIKWYAIFILTGAILSFLWTRHLLKKDGKNPAMYDSFFVLVIPIAIVGARLWYVLGDLDEFVGKDLLYIINPVTGGLAIHGGVIAGIIFGLIYFRKRYKEVPFTYHLDTIVPSVLIGQFVGRWGNFMNQEVYGRCVAQSKLWFIPNFILENASDSACSIGEVNHPLFLYESVLNFIGFILIAVILRNFWKKYRKPGDLCACYLLWYGIVRGIMEPFREEEFIMTLFGIKFSVATSVLFIAIGLTIMIFGRIYFKDKTFDNLYINKQTLILQEEKAKRHQELIQQKKQEILEKRKLEKNCK